jgi:hypothetical protein
MKSYITNRPFGSGYSLSISLLLLTFPVFDCLMSLFLVVLVVIVVVVVAAFVVVVVLVLVFSFLFPFR